MNIAIIGSNGQLGTALVELLSTRGHFIMPLTHGDVEISNPTSVAAAFEVLPASPSIVINAAAYNNVDEAEGYPNSARAFSTNTLGPYHLALECQKRMILLVHFSTDYVFDGYHNRPYHEEDQVAPINVYGASKATGEMLIRSTWEKHYILRTCGLYGHGFKNFVDTVLSYPGPKAMEVVNDQIVTPTPTTELAIIVANLIEEKLPYGTYHATCQGQCSWYEFANRVLQLSDMPLHIEPIAGFQVKQAAQRPKYSVLENGRLKWTGLDTLSHWEEALEKYLMEESK